MHQTFTLDVPDRAMRFAVHDWGGDGPLALLAHANSFCAALWTPVAARLRARYHVVGYDLSLIHISEPTRP